MIENKKQPVTKDFDRKTNILTFFENPPILTVGFKILAHLIRLGHPILTFCVF